MQFNRLRLQGFKSFVDPTELLIEPGLTGIVGPNGCGKSNLVEALQWVMGEGSARRLRGGDMEDVIFAGTATRPGKASANVCLDLANVGQAIGLLRVDSENLEIERRITRGKGSTYRVNGREQRARDVQTLFADSASGAQSVSLIGQGRIGWLINAKPTERRSLLEEAAGIAGLQGRRREAETKLAAAEANLARLADAQAGLIQQIERLKKQARVAERYRRLSESVTEFEAALLHRLWLEQNAERGRALEQLHGASALAEKAARGVADAESTRLAAASEVPPLREIVVARDALVVQQNARLLAIDGERERAVAQLAQARQLLAENATDTAREAALADDAERALKLLSEESAGLEAEFEQDRALKAEIGRLIAAAEPALAAREEAVTAATGKLAADKAARAAAETLLGSIARRLRQSTASAEHAASQIRQLEGQQISDAQLAAAETEIAAEEARLASATPLAERAALEIAAADAARQTARTALNEAERRYLSAKAEIDALRSVLADTDGAEFPPILDQVEVSSGYETALGAALGDDLLASADEAAPRRWCAVDGAAPPPLPEGAAPISAEVTAPAVLARRLAAIGIVPDEATGRRLHPALRPGQLLVTPDGSVWRWDGLAISASAASAAAIRLAQRNRLTAALAAAEGLETALTEARAAEQSAIAHYHAAQQAEKSARAAQWEATQRLSQLRRTHIAQLQAHSAGATKLRQAIDTRDRLAAEIATLNAERMAAEQARAELPDQSAAEADLAALRDDLRRARETLGEQQRRADFVERDIAARQRRLAAIAKDQLAWRQRQDGAAAQRAAQSGRRAALEAEIALLSGRPDALARDRLAIADGLESLRGAAAAAAADLGAAETRAAEAERRHAAALHANGEARERLIRAEALVERADFSVEAAARQIRERFDCAPQKLADRQAPGDTATEALEQRLATARRDRDALGPVNLMAETELAALSAELELIRLESADLSAAISKLRQAIGQINHEGRERLQAAFDAVNQHFQALFVRLFGGGAAYLELSFADGDPLAAGLEIMASPPGKKLQILSLLSGGERALTALALIFAAFLANPAPICVLDEVDAPLDDANVERFTILVREIAERAATRFLIVTHHRVTMARMDRLYGVTMMERGISRLVSVELQAARQLRRTA